MFALSERDCCEAELNLSAAFSASAPKIKAKTAKAILNLSKWSSL